MSLRDRWYIRIITTYAHTSVANARAALLAAENPTRETFALSEKAAELQHTTRMFLDRISFEYDWRAVS